MKRHSSFVCGIAALMAFTTFAVTSDDYSHVITMSVNPARYSAEEVGEVHTALRISESITGFLYSDTNAGKDLFVTDEDGNELGYDLECWNPEGESILWVKMPKFAKNRKVYVYYGGPEHAPNPSAVWPNKVSDSYYTGVWHMSESSGDVADATGNGNTLESLGESAAQSVATPGAVGSGRITCTSGKAWFKATNVHDMDFGSSFWISGWFKSFDGEVTGSNGQVYVLGTKDCQWGRGWNLRLIRGTTDGLLFEGDNNNPHEALCIPDTTLDERWTHVTMIWGSGDTIAVYIDGEKATTLRSDDLEVNSWVKRAADSSTPLSFGYLPDGRWDDGYSHPFHGAFDELRYGDGTMSAKRAKAEYVGQAYADLFICEAKVVGLDPAVTCTVNDQTAELTIGATLTGKIPEGATIYLLVNETAGAEPTQELKAPQYVVATKTSVEGDQVAFTWQGRLGTKVSYAIAMGDIANPSSLASTDVGVVTLLDNAQYYWKRDLAEGDWANADNWAFMEADKLDSRPRVGFPSYGASFRFFGDGTHRVTVGGVFDQMKSSYIDNSRLNLTLVGTTPNAKIEPAGLSYAHSTHIVLDAVEVKTGGWEIQDNASLTLKNGAKLTTNWHVKVNGANARLVVESGSSVYASAAGDSWWYCLQLQGENAEIVLDDGTISTEHLFYVPGDSAARAETVAPKGVVFKGTHPQLIIRRRANLVCALPQPMTFSFVVPVGGYEVAPIVRGRANRDDPQFLEPADETVTPIHFVVDRASPIYSVKGINTFPIVDWNFEGTTTGLASGGRVLEDVKYGLWTVDDEANRILLTVEKKPGLAILIK